MWSCATSVAQTLLSAHKGLQYRHGLVCWSSLASSASRVATGGQTGVYAPRRSLLCFCVVLCRTVDVSAQTSATVRVVLVADLGCTDAKSREAVYNVLSSAPGVKV